MRAKHMAGRVIKAVLHYGDLSSAEQLTHLTYNLQPDEIYHLGAQSHVQVSFEMPEYTGDITGLGTTRVLEAIRRSGIPTRFYNAASSEMFGDAPPPQSEQTPFRPRSPYAAAKVYACWMTRMYREGYNLFACNGILFNHEGPRRGETFVTRKITRGLALILGGQMVEADLEAVGLTPPGEGKKLLEARFGPWHSWGSAVMQALRQAERAIE